MKTLIEKYKELVAKLKETVMHVGFGTDTPIADLQAELNDAGCKECKGLAKEIDRIESEIAELEQNNPALREELIAFAEFVNMKMPVITEKYIDEYLSSRQEKPNTKEI